LVVDEVLHDTALAVATSGALHDPPARPIGLLDDREDSVAVSRFYLDDLGGSTLAAA
jgi:hypothetical protein